MGFGLLQRSWRPLTLVKAIALSYLNTGEDQDTWIRSHDVETFWKKGIFKPESNVQFGEGGAGTFDGKLTTRVTHPRLHEISKYFVEFGAPEILYKHKASRRYR